MQSTDGRPGDSATSTLKGVTPHRHHPAPPATALKPARMPARQLWRARPALAASAGLLAVLGRRQGFFQHFRSARTLALLAGQQNSLSPVLDLSILQAAPVCAQCSQQPEKPGGSAAASC